MYTKLRKRLFHSDDNFSISFTMDIWSCDGGESFISWTLHYISSEFCKEERVLQVMSFFRIPYYRRHIRNDFKAIRWIEHWVHTIIRDNAANMVADIRQCGLPAVSCTIHTVQLVVKDSILAQGSVIDMLGWCRKIVGNFKHSSFAIGHMQSIQHKLNLVEHKWAHSLRFNLLHAWMYVWWSNAEQYAFMTLIMVSWSPRSTKCQWLAASRKNCFVIVQRVTKELSAKKASIIPFLEIKTYRSESRGQEEAAIACPSRPRGHYSE